MRIAVTGASGLLGLTLCHVWRDNHIVFGLTRESNLAIPGVEVRVWELTSLDRMAGVLDRLEPDVVVHCAAMTNVDACEQSPAAAHFVNCEIPRRLAMWCESRGVTLLHISTDAVFDGYEGGYTESSAPNPLNVYGRSKLDGESAVAAALPNALIARINLYGWSRTGSRSLAEFFVNRLAAGEATRGFTDLWFSPLLANDLAGLLLAAMETRLEGVRHFASSDSVSKWAFGQLIADVFDYDPALVRPAASASMALTATRPKRLMLNGTLIASELGIKLPTVEEGVRRLRQLSENGYRTRIRALGAWE